MMIEKLLDRCEEEPSIAAAAIRKVRIVSAKLSDKVHSPSSFFNFEGCSSFSDVDSIALWETSQFLCSS